MPGGEADDPERFPMLVVEEVRDVESEDYAFAHVIVGGHIRSGVRFDVAFERADTPPEVVDPAHVEVSIDAAASYPSAKLNLCTGAFGEARC